MSTRPERERASTSTDAVLQATVALSAGHKPAFRGFVKDPPRARAHAAAMFVSNAREAEPFVAPDLSEIRVLVDRATVGVASVSLAHATVAAGAETVWHRIASHR